MKKFILFLSDALVLFGSLLLTLYLRYGSDISRQFEFHLLPFSLIFIVWLVVFYISNLYEPVILRNNIHFYSPLLKGILISSVISVIFFYLFPLFKIAPKTNLVIFSAVFTILEFGSRYGINKIFEKGFKRPLILVGLNEQSLELAGFISENPQLGYELKYIVDLHPEKINETRDKFKKITTILDLDYLESTIKRERIHNVAISPEAYQESKLINIFYRCLEQKISFVNLASFYEHLTGKVPLGAINQIWFLENLSEGKKKDYEIIKRSFDITFAILIGIVSLILYPFLALLIKLTSKGPVFYKQKRVGRVGKVFEIIKFRTMNKDAEKNTGAVWTIENDPRITKIGNFLRKTRLDEIPQIFNILKGEMSFVGPRAERPEFHETLQQNVPFYEERYLIKPGLTGWAQINFHYGASVGDAAEKLKYDLYYIKNRSLLLDLGIILKTIRIALRQAGR